MIARIGRDGGDGVRRGAFPVNGSDFREPFVRSVLRANKEALRAGAKTVRAEINGVTWEVGVTPFGMRASRDFDKAAKKPPEIDRLFDHVLHVVPLP